MVSPQEVRTMAEVTQFLFISHNKITMEMANQLVGITMPDPGVSRVVARRTQTFNHRARASGRAVRALALSAQLRVASQCSSCRPEPQAKDLHVLLRRCRTFASLRTTTLRCAR